MPDLELRAELRSVLGKKVARLRHAGVTPANVFGHNLESQAIQVPTPELTHLLRRAGATHLLRLDFGRAAIPRMVLVRHVSRKPTTDQILHVDFYQVSMTERTTVEIPLILVGSSPAAELGEGVLVQQVSTLPVECLPGDIPEQIEVDISGLAEVHSAIHVSDLPLPANVTTSIDPAEVVVSIAAAARAEEVEEAAAAAEEVAAAAEGTEAAEAEQQEPA